LPALDGAAALAQAVSLGGGLRRRPASGKDLAATRKGYADPP